MTAKSIFESKTFWIAVTQGVVGVIVVLATQYPTLGSFMIAKSVLDVILRFLTEQSVTVGQG